MPLTTSLLLEYFSGLLNLLGETSVWKSQCWHPVWLEQLFHIFAYLKAKHNAAEMVFDPSKAEIDESLFEKQEGGNTVYGECSEELPPDAPASCSFGFKMRSDHAGDMTCRSRNGILVYVEETDKH